MWCRPGTPCNQRPTGKASAGLKSSLWCSPHKNVKLEPGCCGWMIPAAPSWSDSGSSVESWCFPTHSVGCAPCPQCEGCLCCGGRSVPARTTHAAMYIPEGPGPGWTILPAQIEHKCPTVAQFFTKEALVLLGALPHHPKQRKAWALGGHTGQSAGNVFSMAAVSWAARLV